MTPVPPQPRIYHITHVDNLPAIVAEGWLVSDATMVGRGGPPASIGMSSIKQRRLRLPVTCHPGDCVGDYVPFYFCPRSVMLFVIKCGNDPELRYRGGQAPIVHLEADLGAVVKWADARGRRWAFSLSNAGASYAEFRRDLADLGEIDWSAVASNDFRDRLVKEGKQAELLLHESCPWSLVQRIGVKSRAVEEKARLAIQGAKHQPHIQVMPTWYF